MKDLDEETLAGMIEAQKERKMDEFIEEVKSILKIWS